MSCPHTTTTTLLWLYGEAADDHALHVATCAECQDVAALHTDVALTTAPIAPALQRPPTRRRLPWVALAALAAAALLCFLPRAAPHVSPSTTHAPIATLAVDDLDLRLDALHEDVLHLTIDLETL